MTSTDEHIRQAAPLDSTRWSCAGCTATLIGTVAPDRLCRDCAAARPVSAASWQKPRILKAELATWAARDDTRPDPKARAAADDALASIDATIAELAALRVRLEREIAASEPADCEIAEDDPESGLLTVPPLAVLPSSVGLVHDEPADVDADSSSGSPDGLTRSEAVAELLRSFSDRNAWRILVAAEERGTYRDDVLTVTMLERAGSRYYTVTWGTDATDGEAPPFVPDPMDAHSYIEPLSEAG